MSKQILLYENENLINQNAGIVVEKGRCKTVREAEFLSVSDKVVTIYRKHLIKGVSKNGVEWSRKKTYGVPHEIRVLVS